MFYHQSLSQSTGCYMSKLSTCFWDYVMLVGYKMRQVNKIVDLGYIFYGTTIYYQFC